MARTGFRDDFWRNFLTGLAALFPIVITLFLFAWLYHQIDVTIGEKANAVCREVLARDARVFRTFFPGAPREAEENLTARRAYAREHFPRFMGVMVGLTVLAVAVYLVGRFLRGYIGRRVMRVVDRFFERFPVIKAIYPHARQVGDFIFGQSQRRRFSSVVAVQYPRRGVYSVGFMTGEGLSEIEQRAGRDLVTVFMPTSPTPLTGFVIVLPPDEVIELNMTVDEAFRYCITAGMLKSGRARMPGAPEAAVLATAPGAEDVGELPGAGRSADLEGGGTEGGGSPPQDE